MCGAQGGNERTSRRIFSPSGAGVAYRSSSFTAAILRARRIVEALPSEERCRRAAALFDRLAVQIECANVRKARLFLTASKALGIENI